MAIMKEKRSVGVYLAYTLIGGAVGAAVGMLLAPRSGSETRGKIISTVKGSGSSIGTGVKLAQEKLQETGQKIGSSTERLFKKGRIPFLSEGRDTVAEALDAAKRAYLAEKDAWMLKRQ